VRWRFDACGALIERSKYGDTDSNLGWEIDHVVPVSKNGVDSLWNLQPLHWQNNRKKGDGMFLNAAEYCALQYSGS
jgi:5-methylcytosine-specific restriction endonuclease McrA